MITSTLGGREINPGMQIKTNRNFRKAPWFGFIISEMLKPLTEHLGYTGTLPHQLESGGTSNDPEPR